MVLETNEGEDVLEAGLEIIAQPPGKQPKSITLLSGGEKALTAIALLFGVYQIKPSPFCILDEVDAPLDDSNTDVYCRMIEDFCQHSQFIVVTHNKRTMQFADAIYGITQSEPGVSQKISVKLENIEEHQELLTPAQAAARLVIRFPPGAVARAVGVADGGPLAKAYHRPRLWRGRRLLVFISFWRAEQGWIL